ncbi:hypothetical protein Rcae01_01197 [Novipirellula caenicola]|uniref:Uncharacterized protein n=1 Tax=Novipirellula caenicola TaxID=1536901 RepID=A0ABP9VMD9_9BACT
MSNAPFSMHVILSLQHPTTTHAIGLESRATMRTPQTLIFQFTIFNLTFSIYPHPMSPTW